MTPNDLKRIFKVLGPAGTEAGLMASEVTLDDLYEIAMKLELKPNELQFESRDQAIRFILGTFVKKEIMPLEKLMEMNFDQLVDYFENMRISSDDLMKLVKQLNYKVGAEDRKHLRKYVARQISETALFNQVATRPVR